MNVVLFEPHHDDAVLFASYTLLREQPLVVTVLGRSVVQGPAVESEQRVREGYAAFQALGLNPSSRWFVWHFRDDVGGPSSSLLREHVAALDVTHEPELVYAPLPEEGGHEHHNRVGEIAAEVFGKNVVFYATYRRGERRTRTETEVPFEPHWPALKLRAMACYESQITLENTRPWFDDWQREWVARP